MAQMTLVREDEKGLFIKAGGYIARPGGVVGYDHVLRMDDGGLKKGDKVVARHSAGSPLNYIKLPNGEKLWWHHDYSNNTGERK